MTSARNAPKPRKQRIKPFTYAATGLAGVGLAISIGACGSTALAEKLAFPEPASALEWPELRVHSVVPQPDDLSPVILEVGWPAYPERVTTLLVALNHDEARALSLLCQWSTAGAAVMTLRQGAELELRRRQSLERVHATLLKEGSHTR